MYDNNNIKAGREEVIVRFLYYIGRGIISLEGKL